jgi:hypothetical protein
MLSAVNTQTSTPWRNRVNIYQAVVAVTALVGVTVLGALGKVDSNVLIAIYSAVIGGGIGHANGYSLAKKEDGR